MFLTCQLECKHAFQRNPARWRWRCRPLARTGCCLASNCHQETDCARLLSGQDLWKRLHSAPGGQIPGTESSDNNQRPREGNREAELASCAGLTGFTLRLCLSSSSSSSCHRPHAVPSGLSSKEVESTWVPFFPVTEDILESTLFKVQCSQFLSSVFICTNCKFFCGLPRNSLQGLHKSPNKK